MGKGRDIGGYEKEKVGKKGYFNIFFLDDVEIIERIVYILVFL